MFRHILPAHGQVQGEGGRWRGFFNLPCLALANPSTASAECLVAPTHTPSVAALDARPSGAKAPRDEQRETESKGSSTLGLCATYLRSRICHPQESSDDGTI